MNKKEKTPLILIAIKVWLKRKLTFNPGPCSYEINDRK